MTTQDTPTQNKGKFLKGDKVLWMIFFILAVISIVEVSSAASTLAYQGKMYSPIIKHTGFVIISLLALFLSYKISIKAIKIAGVIFYLGSILLLIFAQFNGTSINNAVRWVPIFGITFQPSEIAKLSIVLLASTIFSSKMWNQKKLFYIFLFTSIIPIAFIGKDNLSTGVVLIVFVYIVSWIAKAPTKTLAQTSGVLAGFALLFALFVLFGPSETVSKVLPRADTWKHRIIKDPSLKGLNEAQLDSAKFSFNKKTFQPNHAKIAIARGRGIVGVGPGNSIERDILPSAFSDYIYAIIIEEWGLLGAILVPLIYIWLFFRLAKISGRSRNLFTKLTLLSFGVLYIMQAMINFTVGTSIFVTGQTLPLISRGGTSYVITSVGFMIIIALSRLVDEEEVARAKERMELADRDDSDGWDPQVETTDEFEEYPSEVESDYNDATKHVE